MYVDLVKPSHVVVPEGTPRIKFFTNEMLEDLESNRHKRDRNDEQIFEGLLVYYSLALYKI